MNFRMRPNSSSYALSAIVAVLLSTSFLCGQTSAALSNTAKPDSRVSRGATTFLAAPALGFSSPPSGVASADLDADGKPDLIVASSSTGKVSVYLGHGKGRFGTPIDYSAGGAPSAVIVADIDGDGTKDIVTANGKDGTISVLLTIAGGRLGAARIYPTGFDADFVWAGDLNGDGKQDLLVASRAARTLTVLLNDGQGVLVKTNTQVLGQVPVGLTVADINGDGHVDAAVAYENGTVDILVGAGDGTFKSYGVFQGSSTKLSSIASADFNGDGRVDLAVVDPNARLVMLFVGMGDGSFSKGSSYKVGSNPTSIAATDMNGDGIVDLITVNNGSNTISVLSGQGDGSFQAATDFTVGGGPVALAVADFEGKGHAGLAVINSAEKSVSLVAGKADGTLLAAPSYSGDLSPRAIASGDLNGDGIADIVVANFCGSDMKCSKAGSLSVYLGQQGGGYQPGLTQALGSGPVSLALADLNGDGFLDVVALNRSDKSVSVLFGNGDGSLQVAKSASLAGSPVAVVAKDFDGDGKMDLAVLTDCGAARCTQRGSVDIYFGLGDGTFRFGASAPVNYSPTSIAAGDLNEDGVVDLVVTNACGQDASCNLGGTATVLLGAARGTFHPQPDITLKNEPSSVALRATTGSLTLDLVVSHEADNTVAVLPGNGDGTFKSALLYTVGASPRSLVIADLNGDGMPDVAVANVKDSSVSVLYGQADGTLVSGGSYAVAAGPEALTAFTSATGKLASLVTANGNSASSSPGSEITSLSNLGPNSTTPTGTALSITSSSGTVNSSFTLQATLSPAPPDGELVTFSSDVTQFTDCANPAPLTSGVASCTTSQLTAGQRTLTASYPGDTDFDPSQDNEPQTVGPLAATLTLAGPSAAPTVNQSVTYTATLGTGPFTPTTPSGTVSFTITGQAGAACANVTLSAGGTSAACTFNAVSAGAVSVVASYAGDANFTVANSSNTVSQTVSPAAATLSLAGPSFTPAVNQSLTYTATLASGSFTPTTSSGIVSFTVSGQSSASCPDVTLSGGATTANCTLTAVAAGSIAVVASYASDANFVVTGASNTVSQTVSPVAATLTVAAPSISPVVNQAVTYVATLGAGSGSFFPTGPSGTVSFAITGQQGLTCAPTAVSSSLLTASCSFTPTSAGSVTVVASYAGDSNFTVPNGSSPVTRSVAPAAATLTLAAPTASPTVNQATTFTATLGPASGSFSPTAPAGIINFTITGQQGSACPSTQVSASTLTASCTFTPLAAGVGSLTVTANYANDSNFVVPNGSAPVTRTVNQVADTLSLVSSSPISNVNQAVTFTASMGPVASLSPTAPTGSVSFNANGSAISSCQNQPISVGLATCTIASLNTFADTITATYSGDSNYLSSTAPPITQSVNPVSATTAVSASLGAVVVNQTVTLTATVQGSSSGPVVPMGSVNFMQGGVTLCSMAALTAASETTATATCQAAFSAINSTGYTVTATFIPSNTNFTAGTAGVTSPIIVGPATTSTSLAFSPSAGAVVNQSVTITATVMPSFTGTAVLSGTVTFLDQTSSATLCNAVPVVMNGSSGTASCSSVFLAQGTHPIVASFTSTSQNFGSSTITTSQTVGPENSLTSLVAAPASATVNAPVIFTATVMKADPTFPGATVPQGTVSFLDGSTPIANCGAVTLSAVGGNSTASCTALFTSAATHNVTTVYTPITNFRTSTSAISAEVVTQAATVISLASSPPSAPTVDQPVVFTATIVAVPSGASVPTGTVTFLDLSNGSVLCGSPLPQVSPSGLASCQSTFLMAGKRTIQAVYSGDNNFAGNSGTEALTVGATSTTVTLTALQATSVVDQSVTFSTTLTSTQSGVTVPTGTIVITDATPGYPTLTQCTLPVGSNGGTPPLAVVPACPISFAVPGVHSVLAMYMTTDGNFVQSASAPFVVTVAKAATSVTLLAASPSTSAVNQMVNFSGKVSVQAPSGSTPTAPSGVIAFFRSGVPLCTTVALASDGTASCAALLGSAGTYSVTASYSGDSNFISSGTANPGTQVVNAGGTAINLVASSSTSVATNTVTFTATLSLSPSAPYSPTTAGSVPVAGVLRFNSQGNGVLDPVCSSSVSPITPGAPYTCKVTFPINTAGATPVTATFTPANGDFAPSTTSAAQNVQNFSIALNKSPASPAIVYVTQGMSSTNDPLFPSTIGAVVTPISAFADIVTYSCSLPVTGLTCAVTAPSGTLTPSIVVSATSVAAAGTYTALVAATDSTSTALTHSTSFTVQVDALVASLNVSAGATGSLQVPFPNGLTLNPITGSNYCPNYILNGVLVPTSSRAVGITCTTASNQTSNGALSLTITTTSATSVALVPTASSRISLATLIGVPMFLLATCRRRKSTLRSNWVRSVGVLSLLVSLSSFIGCGGGFTTTPQTNVATAAGTYQLEVVATDSSGKLYYAIIPLVVN